MHNSLSASLIIYRHKTIHFVGCVSKSLSVVLMLLLYVVPSLENVACRKKAFTLLCVERMFTNIQCISPLALFMQQLFIPFFFVFSICFVRSFSLSQIRDSKRYSSFLLLVKIVYTEHIKDACT